MIRPNIENPTRHQFRRGCEGAYTRRRHITDVDKGTPLVIVENNDLSILHCACGQKIYNQVKARSRRMTKDRRKAQNRWVKSRGVAFEGDFLRSQFRLSIQRDGVRF